MSWNFWRDERHFNRIAVISLAKQGWTAEKIAAVWDRIWWINSKGQLGQIAGHGLWMNGVFNRAGDFMPEWKEEVK